MFPFGDSDDVLPSPAMLGDDDLPPTRASGQRQIRLVTDNPGPSTFYLNIISGGSVGKVFRLTGDMLVGRATAEIAIDDEGVSRRHARIEVLPDGVPRIMDLGSMNGIFVNGLKVDYKSLAEGDRLRIGSVTMLVVVVTSVEDPQWNMYTSATRDLLTGLYSREYLFDHLTQECKRASVEREPPSLLLCQIFPMEELVTIHGWEAIKSVMLPFSWKVSEAVGTRGLVGRLTREELAVVFRDTSPAEVASCVSTLKRTIREVDFGFSIPLSLHTAVATLGEGLKSHEQLLQAAHRSMVESVAGSGQSA